MATLTILYDPVNIIAWCAMMQFLFLTQCRYRYNGVCDGFPSSNSFLVRSFDAACFTMFPINISRTALLKRYLHLDPHLRTSPRPICCITCYKVNSSALYLHCPQRRQWITQYGWPL